jgi:hypothetical protein
VFAVGMDDYLASRLRCSNSRPSSNDAAVFSPLPLLRPGGFGKGLLLRLPLLTSYGRQSWSVKRSTPFGRSNAMADRIFSLD